MTAKVHGLVYDNLENASSIFTQLKRSFAITIKDIKIYYNKGPVVIQGVFFPLMLFFAFTFGRIIEPAYVISGLMALMLFLTATSIGPVILPWETMQKTIEKMITCPISIKTILLGNMWSSIIFSSLFALVPCIVGLSVYGLWPVANILVIIIGLSAAAFAFSSFGLLLSVPPSDNPSGTMILTLIVKLPLIFLSPLFREITGNLIYFINPLVYFLDLVNAGLGKTSIFTQWFLLIDTCSLIVMGTAFLLLAFYLHSKTLQKRISG